MAPVIETDLLETFLTYVNKNHVMIFSKTTCPFCRKVKEFFDSLKIEYYSLELDTHENGPQVQQAMAAWTGTSTVPQVFVDGHHIGGCDETMAAYSNGTLEEWLDISNEKYDYDLIVIGGGSGGLSASKAHFEESQYDGHYASGSKNLKRDAVPTIFAKGKGTSTSESLPVNQKWVPFQEIQKNVLPPFPSSFTVSNSVQEAARLEKKVAVLDFVVPTPIGTTWGLGGTCVNVGCIPKKLMHQAALLGQAIKDAKHFGWNVPDKVEHNWAVMREAVQNHIISLNWNYKVQLRTEQVKYVNAYAEFIDPHTIKATDKKGKETTMSARRFIIATGERPRYPDIEGAKEYGITSDDLFSLKNCPGKTLVIGASYVALECAGFLAGLGLDVTIMVRSILLRGFDQDMAERVGKYMESEGIKFLRPCVPLKVEKDNSPHTLKVTGKMESGELVVDNYDTVLFAIGRNACTDKLGLDKAGVIVNPKNGKIPVVNEQTNVPHIYAVGDILEGKPELTPVAIEAGMLLARRLYFKSDQQCDYMNVPTTVFTPLEYGCIGYSEEFAFSKFGEDNVQVYHSNIMPLEWTVPERDSNTCYVKLICLIPENDKVIGFHYLGPNAGEVTQGFTLALKMGATKVDFDSMIGIHPTCAEIFSTLTVTKDSGKSAAATGC